ncbi:MAG: hypothetical protein KDE34_16870, partial [Anaerolineales bacterium]|nr:hypothetical protein [Anaerolineales bacterium]
RLVFVADQIHSQLRRLVEFLNEKLFDIEVLAVEIKQYEGQGQKALVPRVIGLTEATRKSRRTPAGTGTTDLETFLAACTPGTASYFRWLSEEAERQGMVFYWGTKGFSIRAQLHQRLATFVKCFPPDRFEIYFDKFFDRSEAELQPLRKRLLTFSSLKPAGSSGKVIRATVTGANDQEMRQVFQLMVEQMRHFQSGA